MQNNSCSHSWKTAALLLIEISFVLATVGCVGYVQGESSGAFVAEPDVYLYGGYYDPGPFRYYGRRGYESRHFVRPAPGPSPRGGDHGRRGGRH